MIRKLKIDSFLKSLTFFMVRGNGSKVPRFTAMNVSTFVYLHTPDHSRRRTETFSVTVI
jgi:hypothetical protein